MANFNFKKSFSLINAAIGGRDVLSEQLIQAHRAGVDPLDWYQRYTKSLIEDHTQGITYPLLVITTATKEQSHGLNKGKKAGDDMLDLSVGAGKTIKNRVGQWENLVRVGINPKENEVFSAWVARSAAMVESFKTINARRLSMGFPVVDATDDAGRLHEIMQLHGVLGNYQDTAIAILARGMSDTVKPAATVDETVKPAATVDETVKPAATVDETVKPAATVDETVKPAATVDETVKPAATVDETVKPAATVDETVKPAATVDETVKPAATVDDTKDTGPKHGSIVSRDTRKKMLKVLAELEGKYSVAELDCLLTLLSDTYQPVMLAA